MYAILSRAMWASNSRIQLCGARGALSRHTRPFASVSALASASSSASAAASASTNLRRPGIKKPQVIEWQENMPGNKATLIGTLVREIQIHYLSSGKIVASSSLKVKRRTHDFSWFYLEFWDDLAEVAAAHLKMGDFIFVSGSVWQEIAIGKDGSEKIFAKVVAKDFKFVQSSKSEAAASLHSYMVKIDKLWNDLFNNRVDWADFREKKKTKLHPDFKHKSLDAALWLDGTYTPDWVKERLMNEGSL